MTGLQGVQCDSKPLTSLIPTTQHLKQDHSMKVTCSFSGLNYKVQHIQGKLGMGVTMHPIFYFNSRQLSDLYKYQIEQANPSLASTKIDNYLLFLALAYQTGKVEFTYPVEPNDINVTFASRCLSALWETGQRVKDIAHPAFKVAGFRVTKRNKDDIGSFAGMLEEWHVSIREFDSGLIRAVQAKRLGEKLDKLEQTIVYQSYHSIASMGPYLARWANLTAPFPAAKRDLWKSIIEACHSESRIFMFDVAEINEVYEWCAQEIIPGSLPHHYLLELLAEGKKKNRAYLGIGVAQYQIVTSSNPDGSAFHTRAVKEQAALASTLSQEDNVYREDKIIKLLEAAPTNPPKQIDYKSRFEWVKAKALYQMAQAAKKEGN